MRRAEMPLHILPLVAVGGRRRAVRGGPVEDAETRDRLRPVIRPAFDEETILRDDRQVAGPGQGRGDLRRGLRPPDPPLESPMLLEMLPGRAEAASLDRIGDIGIAAEIVETGVQRRVTHGLVLLVGRPIQTLATGSPRERSPEGGGSTRIVTVATINTSPCNKAGPGRAMRRHAAR